MKEAIIQYNDDPDSTGGYMLISWKKLVRCKDCKHRDPEDHKCDCGHDIQWQLPRADDWFCADGIAKDTDVPSK